MANDDNVTFSNNIDFKNLVKLLYQLGVDAGSLADSSVAKTAAKGRYKMTATEPHSRGTVKWYEGELVEHGAPVNTGAGYYKSRSNGRRLIGFSWENSLSTRKKKGGSTISSAYVYSLYMNLWEKTTKRYSGTAVFRNNGSWGAIRKGSVRDARPIRAQHVSALKASMESAFLEAKQDFTAKASNRVKEYLSK